MLLNAVRMSVQPSEAGTPCCSESTSARPAKGLSNCYDEKKLSLQNTNGSKLVSISKRHTLDASINVGIKKFVFTSHTRAGNTLQQCRSGMTWLNRAPWVRWFKATDTSGPLVVYCVSENTGAASWKAQCLGEWKKVWRTVTTHRFPKRLGTATHTSSVYSSAASIHSHYLRFTSSVLTGPASNQESYRTFACHLFSLPDILRVPALCLVNGFSFYYCVCGV